MIRKAYPALSLTPQLVEQLLRPFEAVRLKTEVFFHNMIVFLASLVGSRCEETASALST